MENEKYQNLFVEAITEAQYPEELLEQLIPVGKLDSAKVLEVYRGDYLARMKEAMGETLEACWAVLGDETFFELVDEYMVYHPSCHQDLSRVADHILPFLEAYPYQKELPFLMDLAHFELSFWKIFHAPRKESQPPLALTQEELLSNELQFDSSLQLFNWKYKIFDIWKKRELGFEGENLEDFEREQFLILFKNKDLVKGIELNSSQYQLLKLLKEGETLSEALDHIEVEPHDIQSLFSVLTEYSLLN